MFRYVYLRFYQLELPSYKQERDIWVTELNVIFKNVLSIAKIYGGGAIQ